MNWCLISSVTGLSTAYSDENITGPLCRISSVPHGFPSQRVSNVESVSMLWGHNGHTNLALIYNNCTWYLRYVWKSHMRCTDWNIFCVLIFLLFSLEILHMSGLIAFRMAWAHIVIMILDNLTNMFPRKFISRKYKKTIYLLSHMENEAVPALPSYCRPPGSCGDYWWTAFGLFQ